MALPRLVPLRGLQPSQFCVSSEKLAAVLEAWPERTPTTLPPIPVKRYRDRLVATDGHTRALAAHRAGLGVVRVVADEDDLDARVVGTKDYERLWLDRCRVLHRELEARREGPDRS